MHTSNVIRVVTLSVCLLLSPGCSRNADAPRLATTLQPIIGGEPDPGHPAVGYLELTSGACSGTLVTPTVVLTAAHCVEGGLKPVSFTLFGPDGTAIAEIPAKKGLPHPLYGSWGSEENSSARDVALVVLEEPAPVAPVAIRTRPLDCLAGAPLTFVGFGLTDAADFFSGGSKEFVHSTILQVDEYTFTAGTTPGDPGSPCFGDSGGPALVSVGDRDEIVGIISTGDWWCAQEDVLVRVDSHVAWLLEMILEQDPGGLPANCGDGWCDLGEDEAGCPEDCIGGLVGAGGSCDADAGCAAPLHCRSYAGQKICGELCPGPSEGTGCPCGSICRPLDEPAELAGLCIATGYPDSSCGNGECEAGESDAICPYDCTAIPCHEIGTAGCCVDEIATWCESGVLHQQHCAGDLECGWSAAKGRYDCGTEGSADPTGAVELACQPLGPECGNGHCEPGEDMDSCFVDCPLPGYCGDGECGGYEYYDNCPEDCFQEKCDVFAYSGCCLGDTVTWCTSQGQYQVGCGPIGGCGWSEYDMYYTCGPMIVFQEPTGSLPRSCNAYPHEMVCGDGECNGSEHYEDCPEDCLAGGCLFDAPDGCCDGSIVNYCYEGQQYQASCAPYPECGWDYGEGHYMCGTSGNPSPNGDKPRDCSKYPPLTCGDGFCQVHESSQDCPGDCPTWGDCENDMCGPGEDHNNCPQDCIYDDCEFVPTQACCNGDIVQYCKNGQTLMVNCADDQQCGWLASSGYYWCGTDGGAEPSGLFPKNCAAYSNPHCGDGWCHDTEESDWCPSDCPPPAPVDESLDLTSEGSGDTSQKPDQKPEAVVLQRKGGCSTSPGRPSTSLAAWAALLTLLLLALRLPDFGNRPDRR